MLAVDEGDDVILHDVGLNGPDPGRGNAGSLSEEQDGSGHGEYHQGGTVRAYWLLITVGLRNPAHEVFEFLLQQVALTMGGDPEQESCSTAGAVAP